MLRGAGEGGEGKRKPDQQLESGEEEEKQTREVSRGRPRRAWRATVRSPRFILSVMDEGS